MTHFAWHRMNSHIWRWEMAATDQRQQDGKIKDAPPAESQAIEMAWPRAGASVGSRAARKRKIRILKPLSGTGHSEQPGGTHEQRR
jgi:hypothetical protein